MGQHNARTSRHPELIQEPERDLIALTFKTNFLEGSPLRSGRTSHDPQLSWSAFWLDNRVPAIPMLELLGSFAKRLHAAAAVVWGTGSDSRLSPPPAGVAAPVASAGRLIPFEEQAPGHIRGFPGPHDRDIVASHGLGIMTATTPAAMSSSTQAPLVHITHSNPTSSVLDGATPRLTRATHAYTQGGHEQMAQLRNAGPNAQQQGATNLHDAAGLPRRHVCRTRVIDQEAAESGQPFGISQYFSLVRLQVESEAIARSCVTTRPLDIGRRCGPVGSMTLELEKPPVSAPTPKVVPLNDELSCIPSVADLPSQHVAKTSNMHSEPILETRSSWLGEVVQDDPAFAGYNVFDSEPDTSTVTSPERIQHGANKESSTRDSVSLAASQPAESRSPTVTPWPAHIPTTWPQMESLPFVSIHQLPHPVSNDEQYYAPIISCNMGRKNILYAPGASMYTSDKDNKSHSRTTAKDEKTPSGKCKNTSTMLQVSHGHQSPTPTGRVEVGSERNANTQQVSIVGTSEFSTEFSLSILCLQKSALFLKGSSAPVTTQSAIDSSGDTLVVQSGSGTASEEASSVPKTSRWWKWCF